MAWGHTVLRKYPKNDTPTTTKDMNKSPRIIAVCASVLGLQDLREVLFKECTRRNTTLQKFEFLTQSQTVCHVLRQGNV